MSMNDFDNTPGGMRPLPEKKKMSGGAKVLIWLAVAFGGLILLCCGGLVWMGYQFANSISEDPATIAALTDEMAQIDVPEELKPKMSFDMKIPFSGQRIMAWVVYLDEGSQSTLMLCGMGPGAGAQNPEQMQQQVEQSMRQQGMQQQQDMVSTQSETRQLTVRGEPASFTFTTGVTESGAPRTRVNGVFQGKSGLVMIMMDADGEKYTEEQMVRMIEGID